MSIDHRLYLDTSATRHELRDALAWAGIGLGARPDLEHISKVVSAATNVTILDHKDNSGRPDNGVVATRRVTFGDRRLYMDDSDASESFTAQSIQGAMALLRAFPAADAYMLGWDAARPLLLRRGGRLVLAQAQIGPDGFWGAEDSPERALVDLPYTVEPLGPWEYIPVGMQEPELRVQPAAAS